MILSELAYPEDEGEENLGLDKERGRLAAAARRPKSP